MCVVQCKQANISHPLCDRFIFRVGDALNDVLNPLVGQLASKHLEGLGGVAPHGSNHLKPLPLPNTDVEGAALFLERGLTSQAASLLRIALEALITMAKICQSDEFVEAFILHQLDEEAYREYPLSISTMKANFEFGFMTEAADPLDQVEIGRMNLAKFRSVPIKVWRKKSLFIDAHNELAHCNEFSDLFRNEHSRIRPTETHFP